MKKILTVVALQLAATTLIFAQKPMMYLTGYTYSEKNPKIGRIITTDASNTNYKLSGKDAAAVTINRLGELSVKPSALKKNQDALEITLSTGKDKTAQTSHYLILKDQFKQNKVIAHRGAWKTSDTPENSIASLKEAVKLGCYGSEFDVHLSADSVVFVNHDPTIQGVSLEKSDAKTLAKIRLKDGEPLPQLEDFLKAGMEQQTTKLILEIKPSVVSPERAIQLTRTILNVVRELKAEAWIEYISFDYQVCKELVKLAPYAKVYYLKGDKSPDQLASDKLFGLDYHYSVLQKNPDWISDAKKHKLAINVWTVNDAAIMQEFLRAEADFITTNEPELLFKIIK